MDNVIQIRNILECEYFNKYEIHQIYTKLLGAKQRSKIGERRSSMETEKNVEKHLRHNTNPETPVNEQLLELGVKISDFFNPSGK